MKIAIIHYWLVTMRGGEKVLEELCRLYPGADIFTHVLDPKNITETITSHKIETTFISRLPGASRFYQKYLPLMPLALEQIDLRRYDLVISSESGPAKGVITGENTLHLCYCHSPMRYLWNMYHDYRESAGVLTRAVMPLAFHKLRQWDFVSSARVDHFVANSSAVQRRIAKNYRRQAEIIHPPVDVEKFSLQQAPGDFYLCCGQLVPYKRMDLAIEAFGRIGKKLVVVGSGSELPRLRKIAKPNIEFLGAQSDQDLRKLYSSCRALIFPGEEDFGIVPVEAMASGRPVIGYDMGGIRDTVKDGISGVLYGEQSVDCLISAIERFEANFASFDARQIAAAAARFSNGRFREEFGSMVETQLKLFRERVPWSAC